MAGGGGGGGGGGGQSVQLGTDQPTAQTAGNNFVGNAATPGGETAQFVDNAWGGPPGGGAPAAVVGGPNDPANASQYSGLYASTVTPPSSPTGTQSGSGSQAAGGIQKIFETLFGSQAHASTLDNVAQRSGAPASAGWPTAAAAGGPGGGRDPYGNTYTTEPGYQGSPAHPLPPYMPPPGAAPPAAAPPAAAPPAPAPAAAPPAKDDTGPIKPADPTPEVANKPDLPPAPPSAAQPEPSPAPPAAPPAAAQPEPPAPPPQPIFPTPGVPGGPTPAAQPAGQAPFEPPPAPPAQPAPTVAMGAVPEISLQTANEYLDPATASQGSAARSPPTAGNTAITYMDPAGTGNVYASRGDAAAVSPQSSPGSGNTPQGGWQADPNSAIGKLIRGDLPGAFSAGMRALLGQQGLPEDQNMAGKGTPPPPPTPIPTETLARPPGRGDIEAQRISPDRAFRPPIPVPGTFGSTQLAKGDLGSRQPIDPFTARAAGGTGTLIPNTQQAPAPQSQVPAPRGTAAAAVAPQQPQQAQQYPGNTPQHSVANTLSAAGAQPNAIAGIMANIGAESGWSRNATSSVGARGLVQFSPTGEELGAYKSWLTQKGLLKDPGSPQNQMNFLAERLKTAYPQTWARMNAAKSPAQAAEIFAREYERPGTSDLNRRIIQFRNQGVPGVDQQLGGGGPRSQPFSNKEPGVFDSSDEISDKLDRMRADMSKIKGTPSGGFEDRTKDPDFQGPRQGKPDTTFNPKDPLARQLLRDPQNLRKLRPEVLRDFNTTAPPGEVSEAELWERQMTNYYGPNWRARFGPSPVPPSPAEQVRQRFPQ